jgi:protein TonB
MHIAGIYRSKALTYIELTMQDMSGLTARDIPRPRVKTKTPPLRDIKRLTIPRQVMPNLKVEPVETNLPDSLVEGISMPEIKDTAGMQVGDWRSSALAAYRDYVTSNDYYEMVRLKIESQKKYPEIAKNSRIQGHVTVYFVITSDGRVKEAEVVKTSKYKILDIAALKAVQDAAPFQRPPERFFKGPVSMELVIAFEII